ncbi:MAG TPA: RNA polymerase sigma factor [Polyangia bacterium]
MSAALQKRTEAERVPDPPNAAPTDDDRQLVARSRGGDRRAFGELVARHQRAIFLLAVRYLDNVEDARDVAQRTFVQAFQKLGRFRQESGFRTWVYRIAINLAVTALRERGRAAKMAARASSLETEVAPVEPISEREARRLRAAVASLPPKQRLVIELRVYDELSFREVAEVAGSSEDAAKMNFHHALKRLRTLIGEGGER